MRFFTLHRNPLNPSKGETLRKSVQNGINIYYLVILIFVSFFQYLLSKLILTKTHKVFTVIIFLFGILSGQTLIAQIAWLNPGNPSISDTVTLTYNSNTGNKALADYKGTVYLHTGAITERSLDGGDWKHVIGNWGEADERVMMKSLGDGFYKKVSWREVY